MATTDVYTYIGVVANVLNDGLPRTAWLIIGDKTTRNTSSRLSLVFTVITFQIMLGAILTIVFVGSAEKLTAAFIPVVVRETSLSQALGSNLLWMLPWAIAVTRVNMTSDNAWGYDGVIFGGALVFDFFDVTATLLLWTWRLMRGKVDCGVVKA